MIPPWVFVVGAVVWIVLVVLAWACCVVAARADRGEARELERRS